MKKIQKLMVMAIIVMAFLMFIPSGDALAKTKEVISSDKESIYTILNGSKLTIAVGETADIYFSEPKAVKKVKSKKTNIATVKKADGRITVTGVKAGKTKITISTGVGNFAITVTVKKQAYFETGSYIQLTDGSKSVSAQLKNAGSDVKYESTDTGVFTVDKTGKVTPVAPGNATLKAAADGKTYTADVTVASKGLEYNKYAVKGMGKCKDDTVVIGRYSEDGKYIVTTITDDAFKNKSITGISLPDTTVYINDAFDGCKKLISVKFPAHVYYLSANFYGTGITELDLPKSLRYIDGNVGYNTTEISLDRMETNKGYYLGQNHTAIEAFPAANVKKVKFGSTDAFETACDTARFSLRDVKADYDLDCIVKGKTYHTECGLSDYFGYMCGYPGSKKGSDEYALYKQCLDQATVKLGESFEKTYVKVGEWMSNSSEQNKVKPLRTYLPTVIKEQRAVCGTVSDLYCTFMAMTGWPAARDVYGDETHAWMSYRRNGTWINEEQRGVEIYTKEVLNDDELFTLVCSLLEMEYPYNHVKNYYAKYEDVKKFLTLCKKYGKDPEELTSKGGWERCNTVVNGVEKEYWFEQTNIVPRDEWEEDVEDEAAEDDPWYTTFEEMIKRKGHLDCNYVFGFKDFEGPWND